jgi:hypothetical protein
LKVNKWKFFITIKTSEAEKEKVTVKDNRRDALLEIGRLLASTDKNCHIHIHRVKGKYAKDIAASTG